MRFSCLLLHLKRMGNMTLPTCFVFGAFFHHIKMTGGADLPVRRYHKITVGAMTLITFDHRYTMRRLIPLPLKLWGCVPVAISAGDQHLLCGQFRMHISVRLICHHRRAQEQHPQYNQGKTSTMYFSLIFHHTPPAKVSVANSPLVKFFCLSKIILTKRFSPGKVFMRCITSRLIMHHLPVLAPHPYLQPTIDLPPDNSYVLRIVRSRGQSL